jgi:hypothetical protein
MQAFMDTGFGIGLLLLLPLSLVDNAAYTGFVLFRGERKNTAKVLLFGTLIISAISVSLAVGMVALKGRIVLSISAFFPLAIVMFWAWYFALIPQLIIRKVLSKGDSWIPSNRRIKMIIFRIILGVILPVAQYLVHGILGNIFGISSD